jgi:hypothetical protein
MPDEPGPPRKTDQGLATAGLARLGKGQQPTTRQAAAIHRISREAENRDRFRFYSSVPSKHYSLLSGLPLRTLKAQQATLGIPCAGERVDLGKVLTWAHNYADAAAKRQRKAKEQSENLERLRGLNGDLAAHELADRQKSLVSTADLDALVGPLISRMLRMQDELENTIATELALMSADTAWASMPANDRARKVRGFVKHTCRALRQRDADAVGAMLSEAQGAAKERPGNPGAARSEKVPGPKGRKAHKAASAVASPTLKKARPPE